MQYGTPEQKEFFLPRILAGECHFAVGYSEPGAGTDLASLRTTAVRDGDHYIVNGQKIWTSLAHTAKWIYMMVRTDPEAKKYRGITCLLVPMDTPGIEVRPIRNISSGPMSDMFNQVFFNDVRVPVANRLGAEGQGWQIVMSALQNERSGLVEVASRGSSRKCG
jgi:alkylation response protein AidB-like acyl-CoA dehydrogenase